MKQFVIFCLCLLIGAVCMAQDVIITKDSKRINCSVKEISETEVRYKKQENPNGPVFVISVSKISSIVLANGDTLLMDENSNSGVIPALPSIEAKGEDEDAIKPLNDSPEGESFPVTVSLNKVITYSPGKRLEYKNGKYYYDNTYLNDDELNEFLLNTCVDAYGQKSVGELCGILGSYLLLPTGVGLFLVGAVRADKAQQYGVPKDKKTIACLAGGITAAALGGVCLIVELTNKKKIVNVFDKECGSAPKKTYSSNLSLAVSPIRASVTYNF